eukprot:m.24731 g.24731  ORF g.24731 m.24731 type:complete len:330 (+) comp8747_c0_seq1:43-1032(+)
MAPSDNALWQTSVKIAGVVTLYWFVSISMVFLNKHLLSGVSFTAPLFVTWLQCVVAVVFCFIVGHLRQTTSLLSSFPAFEYNIALATKILPLSLVFVGMITFNNLCLQYLGVAFYNVGRSLTTVFNVVLTYVSLGQSTSVACLSMCGVIICGFFLGVDQEGSSGDLSYLGVLYGVLASLCVALNAIYIKKILPLVDDDMWRLTAYNNINAAILFMPAMFLNNEVSVVLAAPEMTSSTYWLYAIVAGLFGIAIGIVTMWQIQVTSPLTHNISGTAKACAQTILALSIAGEARSTMWWLSNALVLGGSMGYTHFRRLEMIEQSKQQPASKA